MKSFITNSSEETILLGKRIVEALPSYLHVILLEGDLSSGKTTLTKGIALGLGVKSVVNSPTFTILKIYKGIKMLYHLDLYRMDNIGHDFDLEEYIEDPMGFTVIEWPNQVEALIPKVYVHIKLTYLDLDKRLIEITTSNALDEWMNTL